MSYPVCRLALSRMGVGAMVGAVVVRVLLRRTAGPCNEAIYQGAENTQCSSLQRTKSTLTAAVTK